MRDYLPLLIIGGILGVIATVFIVAYATMKDKKEAIGFDRYMPDSEITRRLLGYAKPYALQFVFIGMLVGNKRRWVSRRCKNVAYERIQRL